MFSHRSFDFLAPYYRVGMRRLFKNIIITYVWIIVGIPSPCYPAGFSQVKSTRLQTLTACHIRQIKSLDIFLKRSILKFIRHQFCISVNFQHNRNLSGMGMKTGLPKVLKVKPPGDFGFLSEAFSFRGVSICNR